MGSRAVKALAFPVYQKDWLFYAWRISAREAVSGKDSQSSNESSSGVFKYVTDRVSSRVESEWKSVQEAKPWTVKHVLLRFANFVLSKEDPTEAFFKAVPSSGKNNILEISYPDCFSESYVRRHLLFTARNRAEYHKVWYRVTAITIVPLMPLFITPLPNLPIYYLGYRVYSHNNAAAGAATVLQHLEHLETYKPSAPDPDTSSSNSNLHSTFDSSVTTQLQFKPCATLTELAAARDRSETALEDEEAEALAAHYEDKYIAGAIAKIRKKALEGSGEEEQPGSMRTWLEWLTGR